jgi:acetamidase/formamidase
VACEIPTKAIVTLDLIKRKTIRLPRILSKELISSMVEGYGYDKFEAYQLLTQVGVMRVGNMVDPNYSLVARCPTEYFKKRK